MHFFYLDEAGCTGEDIGNDEQPIFVLGGIGLRDEGWNKTQEDLHSIISDYFDGNIPKGFELHACQLLSPNGEGPFAGHAINKRLSLVRSALDLLADRKHSVHFFAINKPEIAQNPCQIDLPYNPAVPYCCAFDYLVTYLNDHVKERLGSSARGMVIFDKKEQFCKNIEAITQARRFEGPKAHRVKWLVEFSYSIDSKKNPMVQLSDLVVVCVRRFLEVELGYRDQWPEIVKNFYAECYSKIHQRIAKKTLVPRQGRGMEELNNYLQAISFEPRRNWRRHYDF